MIIFNSIAVILVVMFLAALSGVFAERSGTVNIGINGMMLVGAIVYWLIQRYNTNTNGAYQIVYVIIAMLSGVVTAMLFGFASITLKADQIISGTAINMIASAIALLLLGKATSQQRLIEVSGWAASTDPGKFLNVISFPLFLGLIILVAAFVSIRYTSWGLRMRAAGENPQALDSQGINVIKTRYIALLISGALASIAGAIYVQKIGTFNGNVRGLGFVGLTILIAGQWRIPWILLASVIFSVIFSVADNLQVIKASLSEIKPLMQSIPFIVSLIFLVIFSKNSRAPAASGVAYDKAKR